MIYHGFNQARTAFILNHTAMVEPSPPGANEVLKSR